MSETTEIKVTYSVGIKVNLGNYESADFHLSEGHTLDVTGMSDEDIAAEADRVRVEIAKRLGDEAVARAMAAKNDREF